MPQKELAISEVLALQLLQKTFNLAAIKVGDFACKIISAPFILVNSSRTIPTGIMPVKVGTVSIFTPFSFTALLS